MERTWQDNRVILLGKSLTLSGRHFKSDYPGGANLPLISLGYFDSLRIYPLPTSSKSNNWLNDMWMHSIKLSGKPVSDVYYHPLYITLSPDKPLPDRFWDKSFRFLFVSLVHFSAKQHLQSNNDRFDTISSKITSLVDNSVPEVIAACYQSMNLSDMVIIWKSDSILAIAKQLNYLYQYEEIGDLRTICSFPLSSTPLPKEEDETIPYLSFRFGVSDAKEAARFITLMHQECPWWPSPGGYLTFGAEDLDFVFHDLKTSQFLNAIFLWFKNHDINNSFKQAFFESSTHLGIHNIPLATANDGSDTSSDQEGEGRTAFGDSADVLFDERTPDKVSNILTETCTNVFNKFQRIRGSGQNHSWCKPVSSQLNALVNMSRICVLDSFCYLILDGAHMFCKKVEPYLSSSDPLPMELLGRIQQFIRGWGTLADQAIRVDGQFIQSPGFSPVLYDIPVSLLEFYIAFAKRCMNLLQSLESAESQHHYALLLLPKLCRRTKVLDIFQDPPPSDRLLYVDVPLNIIYDPQQIIQQLCHEISHYCGEVFRCRKRRINYFVMACSHLIAWYFQLGNESAFKQIYDDIISTISEDTCLYMEYLVLSVRERISDLLRDSEAFERWQAAYLSTTNWPEKDKYVWTRENTANYRTILWGPPLELNDFNEDISRIKYLFEECYADVSMFFLLSPSWKEYISLYLQELLWMKEKAHTSQYAEFVQRAALVLLGTNCKYDFAQNALVQDDPILNRFSVQIHSLFNSSEDGFPETFYSGMALQSQSGYFPADLLDDILSYLKECYQEMTESKVDQAELACVRKIFNVVARNHHIGCKEYRQTLVWYEKQILGLI